MYQSEKQKEYCKNSALCLSMNLRPNKPLGNVKSLLYHTATPSATVGRYHINELEVDVNIVNLRELLLFQ